MFLDTSFLFVLNIILIGNSHYCNKVLLNYIVSKHYIYNALNVNKNNYIYIIKNNSFSLVVLKTISVQVFCSVDLGMKYGVLDMFYEMNF